MGGTLSEIFFLTPYNWLMCPLKFSWVVSQIGYPFSPELSAFAFVFAFQTQAADWTN